MFKPKCRLSLKGMSLRSRLFVGFISQGSERCGLTFNLSIGKTIQSWRHFMAMDRWQFGIPSLPNMHQDTGLQNDKLQEANFMLVSFDLDVVLKGGDEVFLRHGRYAQGVTPRAPRSTLSPGYYLC